MRINLIGISCSLCGLLANLIIETKLPSSARSLENLAITSSHITVKKKWRLIRPKLCGEQGEHDEWARSPCPTCGAVQAIGIVRSATWTNRDALIKSNLDNAATFLSPPWAPKIRSPRQRNVGDPILQHMQTFAPTEIPSNITCFCHKKHMECHGLTIALLNHTCLINVDK